MSTTDHSDWDIDLSTGHCAHQLGIDLFVDSRSGTSGGFRVAGPFFGSDLDFAQAYVVVRNLVVFLERELLGDRSFVVFGELTDNASYPPFEVMSELERFIPDISIRTDLLLGFDNELVSREWKSVGDKLVHRTGVVLSVDSQSMLLDTKWDARVWGEEPELVIGGFSVRDGFAREIGSVVKPP